MYPILIIVVGSFLIPGLIGRTKSILSGRKGPGILQPLYNLILLTKKGSVIGKESSIVQLFGPVLVFSSTLTAALFVPIAGMPGLISFDYDFVMFAYLIALSRFWIIISAMDTGSSFEGMGASREAFYGLLLEPAFFIFLGSFALLTGNSTFASLINSPDNAGLSYYFAAMLGMYILFSSLQIENSRMPYDDPKTHLELTMIHEVMLLDLSGIDLALIQLSNFLKFGIYSSLIAGCILPSSIPIYFIFLFALLIQMATAIAIGFIESFQARNRLNKNPQFILALTAVALVILMIAMLLIK
jgi:formate hydrogenlyase subunit 4